MTTDKTEYKVGEGLDLSTLMLTVEYDNNTSEVIEVTMDMVSGFDSSVPGTQNVTVTYKGKTATFTINIVEEPVELNLISVDKAETEGTYTFTVKAEGDDLGRLHVLLHDGSLEPNLDAIDGSEGKIQYLVLNASEDEVEVYGDEESKAVVNGFGVEASYDGETQTWILTVDGSVVDGKINDHPNYPGSLEEVGLFFYLSNQADRNDRSNIIALDFSTSVVPVELNLISVDKEEADGTYTFTVKAEGDDLGRLHVLLHDGSLEPNLDAIDGSEGVNGHLKTPIFGHEKPARLAI